jgi:hypothetical protein
VASSGALRAFHRPKAPRASRLPIARARITLPPPPSVPPFPGWTRLRAASKTPEEAGFLAGAALAAPSDRVPRSPDRRAVAPTPDARQRGRAKPVSESKDLCSPVFRRSRSPSRSTSLSPIYFIVVAFVPYRLPKIAVRHRPRIGVPSD